MLTLLIGLSDSNCSVRLFAAYALQFAVTNESPTLSGIPTPARFTAFAIFRKVKRAVFFAFILDSLGSTELIFILIVALIFFGPRKLPQLAKSMGKGLAEFRKASDDFKRTWEREVAIETSRLDDNTMLEAEQQPIPDTAVTPDQPVIETADQDLVVARENPAEATSEGVEPPPPKPIEVPVETAPAEAQPLRKQEWL